MPLSSRNKSFLVLISAITILFLGYSLFRFSTSTGAVHADSPPQPRAQVQRPNARAPVDNAHRGNLHVLLDNELVATKQIPSGLASTPVSREVFITPDPYPADLAPGRVAVGPVTLRVHTLTDTAYFLREESEKYHWSATLNYPQLQGPRWRTLNAALKKRYLAVAATLPFQESND